MQSRNRAICKNAQLFTLLSVRVPLCSIADMRGKDGMAYEIQVQRMHRMVKCSQAIMHISFRYTAQPIQIPSGK